MKYTDLNQGWLKKVTKILYRNAYRKVLFSSVDVAKDSQSVLSENHKTHAHLLFSHGVEYLDCCPCFPRSEA